MKITMTRTQAFERAKGYNAHGIATSLSFLPVRAHSSNDVVDDVREYLEVLEAIPKMSLNSDVTIKLMQFGISHSIELARESVASLTQKANQCGVRMWFDQDLEPFVGEVIALATAQTPHQAGVCVQAYRSRSWNDIDTAHGYPIRLVKGFYNDYDIKPWSAVTENYSKLMDKVAEESSYPCFATHDLNLIEKAKGLLHEKDGEIQFFAGVRDDLAMQLVQEGFKVRMYLPYGKVIKFIMNGLSEFDMPREIQRLLHFKKVY